MFNISYIPNQDGNYQAADKRRRIIESDTAAYLAKGGTIDYVAHDVFGDKTSLLSARQKNSNAYQEKMNRARKRPAKKKDSSRY